MEEKTCLKSRNGERIALKTVHIEGQIDGLLATMLVTQRYHNDTGKNLEIVYTFPLAWGATFLGMEVSLGEKKLQATVMEKRQAWEEYEKAIDEGDAPILVEQSGKGLYTANLGNIEDGEEVTIELRYGQLLRFEKSMVNLRIPCAIAPRYGDPHMKGGLSPHETDEVNLFATYPLSLQVRLIGQVARAEILCPTHKCSIREAEEGKVILLNSGAMLDRDVCFTLFGLHGSSFALQAPDADGCMMLASFNPVFPRAESKPLTLKILADCSGSMGGDSIVQLRQALFSLLGLLRRGDHVSYSRFGTGVRHETGGLLPFLPNMEKRLADIFAKTEADMGGTEMEQALLSTFHEVTVPNNVQSSPCVLLITDGEVWNVEGVIAASKACGQRIFAIGVGSAPAESLLRDLAEKTGGACELVSPNANMVTTIMNMIERMRQIQATSLWVDWGCEPLWQSALPSNLYSDETVHVFASFADAPRRSPVLRWVMENGGMQQVEAKTVRRTEDASLARLGGAVRMAETRTSEEALALALRYQLVGAYTALYLVHVREGVKNTTLPTLHQVSQMLAAGHGGFGSVSQGETIRIACCRRQESRVTLNEFCSISCKIFPSEDLEIPAFLRRQDSRNFTHTPVLGDSPTPLQLLQALNDKALKEANSRKVIKEVFSIAGHSSLKDVLNEISNQENLPVEQVETLLLYWLDHYLSEEFSLSRHAQRVLRDQMKAIPDAARDSVMDMLDEMFPGLELDAWE